MQEALVLWGEFSPSCLPDWALRHGQATFWDLLPVDLYHPHRNQLMRLLNAIDAAMTHADLIKASGGFVGICRLQHENMQSLKAGERGSDGRDGPFNARNNARKSGRRDLQRDGLGIIR